MRSTQQNSISTELSHIHRRTNRRVLLTVSVTLVSLFACAVLAHKGNMDAVRFESNALARINNSSSEFPKSRLQPIVQNYLALPIAFEANKGQTDARVKFMSRGPGYSLYLTPTEAVLTLRKEKVTKFENQAAKRNLAEAIDPRARLDTQPAPVERATVRMKLVGGNEQTEVAGVEQQSATVNYFIGNDPAKWQTGVPTYARVQYKDVYHGVDLVYHGQQQQLEYDFVVAAGADPRVIKLSFAGARDVRIDSACGELVLRVRGGEMRQHRPVVYQKVAGVKREIDVRYVMKGKQEVGFEVGRYDASLPLVIDPVLVYSTYLGGSFGASGRGIAVDNAGNAYVTGSTFSLDFPVTPNAFQLANGGGQDAFVTKLNSAGSALVYSTYLGGAATEAGLGIAVDSADNAYVTGFTSSSNFPVTANAFQLANPVGQDAFVAKLNSDGSALVYSTYLGGPATEYGSRIVVDSAGDAYVTGRTDSLDFPVTASAFQSANAGGFDAFVTRVNGVGSALVYSTYLGGSGFDAGNGIAVDSAGDAYVTGDTTSIDFPVTAGAFQTANAGDQDAFVTKLSSAGSALVYSTYFGGSGFEGGNGIAGIAVDSAGNAYVTGETFSVDFPVTANAFQPAYAGNQDAFVIKLNSAGSAFVYATYLGGSGFDEGNDIAVDSAGGAYATGATASLDFPVTSGAVQSANASGFDAFVTKLNGAGSALVYSTYLGGGGVDIGFGIAVDSADKAYATGSASVGFPVTPNAFQTTGDGDAFVIKIDANEVPPPTNKDQCRNGGWRQFNAPRPFKNQGDCIQFVNSGK